MYPEINILGVYMAPFAGMMLLAWFAMLPLTLLGARIGLSRRVWHPGLFSLALYLILLSLIVLISGARP